MKFYIDRKGGPSPGIELVGTKRDLRELSIRLGAGVDSLEKEGREEGAIRFPELVAMGDGGEWIEFHSAREVDSLFAEAMRRARKRIYFYTPVAFAVGFGFLYFAYVGLRTILAR